MYIFWAIHVCFLVGCPLEVVEFIEIRCLNGFFWCWWGICSCSVVGFCWMFSSLFLLSRPYWLLTSRYRECELCVTTSVCYSYHWVYSCSCLNKNHKPRILKSGLKASSTGGFLFCLIVHCPVMSLIGQKLHSPGVSVLNHSLKIWYYCTTGSEGLILVSMP